jgi:hypothetical protein
MKSRHICASLAVLAAISAGACTAQAQAAGPGDIQRQQDYQHLQDQYQDAQSRYQDQSRDYAAKRETYEHQHGIYEHARANYDAQHGAGAFLAYYRDHSDDYERLYGPGAYGRDFGRAVVYHGYDPYAAYRGNACERRANDDAMAGGVIGALAGGAIGSGMDRDSDGSGDAYTGAVLGSAVGADIGRSAAGCDERGYFFTYYQTFPYREGGWERGPSGRHDNEFYAGRGCRLAIAPARIGGHTEDRYARVCPDAEDHYRFTS